MTFKGLLKVLLVLTLAYPLGLHKEAPKVLSKQAIEFIHKENLCLLEMIHYEARGESTKGKLAVLAVVNNRKHHKDYPSTFCKVIQQPFQFSYRNHLLDNQWMPLIERKGSRMTYNAFKGKDAALVQDAAFKLTTGDPSALRVVPEITGSTLWYKTKESTPKWSKKYRISATIGRHMFYRKKL